MRKKVAIIGGGILGLSLAYELAHKSFDVTLLEKNSDWGGLASGLKIDETYLEKYYHHWFRSDRHIQGLIHELGLGYRLQFLESSMGIFLNGELHNFSGSIDLLRFKPLNIISRVRAGIVSLILQKMPYRKAMEATECTRLVLQILWKGGNKSNLGTTSKGKVREAIFDYLYGMALDKPSMTNSPGLIPSEKNIWGTWMVDFRSLLIL